jgi:hypothetical protein
VQSLPTLLKFVDFCTERWERARGDPAHSPQMTIILGNGSNRVFREDARVFDWVQTNSTSSGQLHSALAALERGLCTEIDNGTDVTPVLNELLESSNSMGVLGVVVNVGKYRPELFAGLLRPLLGNHEICWCDNYRVEAIRYQFDASAWVRAGETAFEMAKQWILAPYRQVALREIAVRLLNSNTDVATFLTKAIRDWEAPSGEKDGLEFRMLVSELDRQNYTTKHDEQSGKDIIQLQYPADLQRDIAGYERATVPKLQALYLPSQCEKILLAPRMLTSEEAGALAAVLTSIPSDEDPDIKRLAQSAAASTLAVKAAAWLNGNPTVQRQVDDVIHEAVMSVGETPESLRHSSILGGRGELKFAVHAVMHRWMASTAEDNEWESQLLRLMTSRDGLAVATLMHIAHANRERLGSKWWRLLQLALLWAGLSLLAPRFESPPTVEIHWTRWLRWLRTRKLYSTGTSVNAVKPLDVARRVERLEEARWKRIQTGKRHNARRTQKGRHSSGLDSHLLEQIFSWLLHETAQGGSPVDEQDRSLLVALWEFEVWRRYEEIDEDGEHAPPSQLGYAVLQKIADLVLSLSPAEGLTL